MKGNKIVSLFLAATLLFGFSGCGSTNATTAQITELEESLAIANKEIVEKNAQIESFSVKLKSQETELENLKKDILTLKEQVEEAAPWFEMQEEERQAKIKEEAERKAQQAKEAQEAKEQEEKIGYETGITFDSLARTPEEYRGEKVKLSGTVIQVLEGPQLNNLLIAVDGNENNILYVTYKKNIIEYRILAGDTVTIYGIAKGLYNYKPTGEDAVALPQVIADKID